MDVMDAYDLIYSEPRHSQAKPKPGGEAYSVAYGEDGKIKVTTKSKKSKKKKGDQPENETVHREAEFQNSTLPVRDFHQTKVPGPLSPPTYSQSELNFLAEKSSETNLRQRPATAAADLNMFKNSTANNNDGSCDASNLIFNTGFSQDDDQTLMKEMHAMEIAESKSDFLESDSQHDLQRTSSKKSVGFKSSLVESLPTPDDGKDNDTKKKKRSPSPKSLLKKYHPGVGSSIDSNESGMTLVQTLNHMGKTKRSRASTPTAPKPSTFENKKSKIPILIPRFAKPMLSSESTAIQSGNPSGTDLTDASRKFQKIGIARTPRKTSREGRKRRESLERMTKKNVKPAELPQCYADQVMVSQNYVRRMLKTGVKPSVSNSSSSCNSDSQSRLSVSPKLSSTGMETETSEDTNQLKAPFSDSSSSSSYSKSSETSEATSYDSSRAKSPQSTIKTDPISTTVVFKTENLETFAESGIINNNGDNKLPPSQHQDELAQNAMSKHTKPPPPTTPAPAQLQKPLEATLPLLEKEMTLTPAVTDESAPKSELLQSNASYGKPNTEISLHSSQKKAEKSVVKVTPCRFHTAGCTAELPRGTMKEEEHLQKCKYRPLPCLFSPGSCDEIVPYHNFLLHQQKHFLIPNFNKACSTQVVIAKEDFEYNQNWFPKWMSWEGHHFFLMLNHRRGKTLGKTGTWVCWVQMFGAPDEAAEFYYDIELYKGANRKIEGTFTVQSIRTPVTDVQKTHSGLVFSDLQVKKISGIGEYLKKEFYIDVVISKKPECDTAVLKYTGSYTFPHDDPPDDLS